ncbi:MAG TPA: hypothetical protein VG146_06650 [Verrucomicrobiae bacterium]|nr:hypothetical protein [Verrucomicrobiae bacterium]
MAIVESRPGRPLSLAKTGRLSENCCPRISKPALLAKEDVLVIPKTSRRERLKENLGALQHPLNSEQLSELERLFPPPSGPAPLDML